MSLLRPLLCLTLLLTVVACGSSSPGFKDAGTSTDAGTVAAGADAGGQALDAGSAEMDAGAAEMDAGSADMDAGSADMDAGSADMDAGAPPDLCAMPSTSSDCGDCTDQTSCTNCFQTLDGSGVHPYNDLVDCVFCTACYTACGSAMQQGLCQAAPMAASSCDTTTSTMSDCQKCQQCAVGAMGACAQQLSACKQVPECVDIAQNIGSTCGSLP